MLQQKEITREIKFIQSGDTSGIKLRQITEAKKRLQYLKTLQLYLEAKPNKEFLERELERLTNRLSLIDIGYQEWKEDYHGKNPKGEYRKLMGVADVENHIKTLRHLLK